MDNWPVLIIFLSFPYSICPFQPGPFIRANDLGNFSVNPIKREVIFGRELLNIFNVGPAFQTSLRQNGICPAVKFHRWQSIFLTQALVKCCSGAYPLAVQKNWL